jgi:uncharacterized protein (UPF0305 family)
MDLLRNGSEIEFMEEIIRILLQQCSKISRKDAVDPAQAESSSNSNNNDEEQERGQDESIIQQEQILCQWFEGIASLPKFSLFKQFANKELLMNVSSFLSIYSSYAKPETLHLYD